MATKQNLIDLVYQDLLRVKPDVRYPRPLIEHNIAKAWNQILFDAFNKDLSSLSFYAKEYTAVVVSLDAVTGVRYSTLPVAIAQLPDKAAGVRRISTTTSRTLQFIPISEETAELKASSEVGIVDTHKIGYVVRYNKVEYDSNMTGAIATVKMSLVVPFDVYGLTETVPIPSGKDEDLIRLSLQFMLLSTQGE
jgi:hypothetical protein